MFGDYFPFPEPTSRTSETERAYKKHGQALRNAYLSDMGSEPGAVDLVGWFVSRNGVYAASTRRAYRAALNFLVNLHFERGKMSREHLKRCLLNATEN